MVLAGENIRQRLRQQVQQHRLYNIAMYSLLLPFRVLPYSVVYEHDYTIARYQNESNNVNLTLKYVYGRSLLFISLSIRYNYCIAKMAEWTIAPVCKTVAR